MSLITAFRPRSTRTSSSLRHRSERARPRHQASSPDDQNRIPEEDEENEDPDAHSIITPSKHTPKPWRALKGSIARGGPLRPFRLLKQDIINVRRRYLSDWTVFNQQIFASAVYVFFTNLLPGITFASDLYVLTGANWGTIEVVFSTGLCGIIFALASIQPLTILGVTGPFSVLAENIYALCHDNFKIPFLPFMAWSLIHAAWMHYVLAIVNAHDWTMRYVTTFSTEIFSLLNSVIYFHKAIQELQRAHDSLSFAAFLYAIIGAIGTMLLAIFLSTAESWRPLFHRYIRLGLAEYAAAISIIIFIAMPHVGELANLDKMTLNVSHSFRPTSPERDTFFVKFWTLPAGWILAAILPGFIITVLFFFDHEIRDPKAWWIRMGHRSTWHDDGNLWDSGDSSGKWTASSSPSSLGIVDAFRARAAYELPQLPASLHDKDIPSQRPSYLPIHYYTMLQIVLTTAIFVLTLTKAAPAFPVLIIALVPFRLLFMRRWWNREVLRFVDAWACREGTPEDDEDQRAQSKIVSDAADDAVFTADAYPLNSGRNMGGDSYVTSRVQVGARDTSNTDNTHEWIELNLHEPRAPEDEEIGARTNKSFDT
uniref:Putative transporter n=1 Tax=Talaromyces marneffei PM1 TaxID=1077442 RepID=A0A093UVB1_TALMA